MADGDSEWYEKLTINSSSISLTVASVSEYVFVKSNGVLVSSLDLVEMKHAVTSYDGNRYMIASHTLCRK